MIKTKFYPRAKGEGQDLNWDGTGIYMLDETMTWVKVTDLLNLPKSKYQPIMLDDAFGKIVRTV